MLFEFTTAGFGGQGILYMGDLIAQAALAEGRCVTFLPTYGVAMRGGTANCVVTISDEEIGSPVLDHPDGAVLMNQPSLVKFQSTVRKGGLIVANETLIDRALFNRDGDVRIVWIPATKTAREVLGAERAANMIALGAFLRGEPVVKIATVERIIKETAAGRRRDLLEKNLAALHTGLDFVAS